MRVAFSAPATRVTGVCTPAVTPAAPVCLPDRNANRNGPHDLGDNPCDSLGAALSLLSRGATRQRDNRYVGDEPDGGGATGGGHDALAVAAALTELNVIDERDTAAIAVALEVKTSSTRGRGEGRKDRNGHGRRRRRGKGKGNGRGKGKWRGSESGSWSASASGAFGAGKRGRWFLVSLSNFKRHPTRPPRKARPFVS